MLQIGLALRGCPSSKPLYRDTRDFFCHKNTGQLLHHLTDVYPENTCNNFLCQVYFNSVSKSVSQYPVSGSLTHTHYHMAQSRTALERRAGEFIILAPSPLSSPLFKPTYPLKTQVGNPPSMPHFESMRVQRLLNKHFAKHSAPSNKMGQ